LASPFLIVIETTVNRSAVIRKLAAILIADVVGFSRHMERDEAGAFARLQGIRVRIVDPKIAEHGGRVVKTAGDGMLLEFGSADAALRCGIDLQRAMSADNQSKAPDERIDFRIGINLGDIIVDGNDIAGDGVNVASRLEALAEPGGICVSAAVREQVHGSLDVGFDDIGEQQVKNIKRPIRVFRVVLDGNALETSLASASQQQGLPSHWQRWAGGLALLVAVGVGVWFLPTFWRAVPTPTPPALSLAILPFATPSGTTGEEQFANALTQDLTTAMGQWGRAKVAANALVASYKSGAVDIRTLARDLNVRYIVEGEVRSDANVTIVTAHLIDAVTGAQAWSDRLRYASSPGMAGQPDPSLLLTKRLRAGLQAAEQRRAVEHPETGNAMNLVLRGDAASDSPGGIEGAMKARPLYLDALRLDPDLVPALTGLYGTFDTEVEETAAPNRAALLPEMDRVSGRAIALNRTSADAWFARMASLEWLGRWDEALVAADRIIALDPAETSGLLQRSWILIQTGRPADAVPFIERALLVDAQNQRGPYHFMCKAKLLLGRYDEAVTACEKAATENNWWINLVYLCAAYAQHGDATKAATAKDALLKQKPGYTISWYRNTYQASPPSFFELVERHLAAGLLKAGIPEK
jgi:adenylate cyclase